MAINSKIFFLFLVFLLLQRGGFEAMANKEGAKDFTVLTTFKRDGNVREEVPLQIDYHKALEKGIVIPSKDQTPDGKFHFSFQVKGDREALRYKIFYRNISYKFPVVGDEGYNFLAGENFYGSWENKGIEAKAIEVPSDGEYHEVKGSFRIVGNPRNEKRYFKDGKNQRWQRNPRMGKYQFWLVVFKENTLPSYVTDLSEKGPDGNYIDPYYYFFENQERSEALKVLTSPTRLKVKVRFDPRDGVYVSPSDFEKDPDASQLSSKCGTSEELDHSAAFKQFKHYIPEESQFDNIPLKVDFEEEQFTRSHYDWYRSFTEDEERVHVQPNVTSRPCETVEVDSEKGTIKLWNPPANKEFKKENVGIVTRHGLTYGKFRAKVKLTELLNNDGVWNGITNAIWLIGQSGKSWNMRRACQGEKGYMSSYYGEADDERVDQVSYSEIDFEILKTVPYCPTNSFPPLYPVPLANQQNFDSWNTTLPVAEASYGDKVSVSCTNWDMACKQPKSFSTGCHPIDFQGKEYSSFRWSDTYRALTQKQMVEDDTLFGGEYYYFEIHWRPTEIIWKVGPHPDRMRVVGYMDKSITSIPGNQMVLCITQEYHSSHWWPGSPFEQKNIPFPDNKLKGKVYEVTVE